jgi:hypothetical protein
LPFDPNYATTVRRKGGDLEITIPPALYSGATRELNLSWTDFVKD